MEMTVLKAKNNLSELLRLAENGEEVLIRRGRKGNLFKIVPVREQSKRTLTVDSNWRDSIKYTDEGIWESEWEEDEWDDEE